MFQQVICIVEMVGRFLAQSLLNSIGIVIGNDNLGSSLMFVSIVCFGLMYCVIRYSAIDVDVDALTFLSTRFIVSVFFLGLLYLDSARIKLERGAVVGLFCRIDFAFNNIGSMWLIDGVQVTKASSVFRA